MKLNWVNLLIQDYFNGRTYLVFLSKPEVQNEVLVNDPVEFGCPFHIFFTGSANRQTRKSARINRKIDPMDGLSQR